MNKIDYDIHKSCSSDSIFLYEIHFQLVPIDFSIQKFALKTENVQFLIPFNQVVLLQDLYLDVKFQLPKRMRNSITVITVLKPS